MWNVRGLGKPARRRQVREHIFQEKIEVVGLQETVKGDFSDHDLQDLAGGLQFTWVWLPARGHSGGILVGVKLDDKEVEDWFVGDFLIAVTIRERKTNFRWVLMTVYGPAQHDLSANFLTEKSGRLNGQTLPVVIGGDFNLIRELDDKSFMRADVGLMNAFNTFIEQFGLREIKKTGTKFTWTNKQDNPVLSNIDRVLVSTD